MVCYTSARTARVRASRRAFAMGTAALAGRCCWPLGIASSRRLGEKARDARFTDGAGDVDLRWLPRVSVPMSQVPARHRSWCSSTRCGGRRGIKYGVSRLAGPRAGVVGGPEQRCGWPPPPTPFPPPPMRFSSGASRWRRKPDGCIRRVCGRSPPGEPVPRAGAAQRDEKNEAFRGAEEDRGTIRSATLRHVEASTRVQRGRRDEDPASGAPCGVKGVRLCGRRNVAQALASCRQLPLQQSGMRA